MFGWVVVCYGDEVCASTAKSQKSQAAQGCLTLYLIHPIPPTPRATPQARPSPRQNRVAKEGVLRGSFGLRRL